MVVALVQKTYPVSYSKRGNIVAILNIQNTYRLTFYLSVLLTISIQQNMFYADLISNYFISIQLNNFNFNSLGVNPTKWSNKVKQFAGCGRVCLTIL